MPETTKTAKAAKTAAAAAAPFDAFKGLAPSAEIPAAIREVAERSVAQFRDGYERMKDAAEGATGAFENSFEVAREGAFAVGVKALDVAKANSDASFAFARDLFAAKTFADVIELQTAFARKQFDSLGAHVKELQELSQKAVADAAKPVKAQVEKAFGDLKTV